jgi:hypothetical protein
VGAVVQEHLSKTKAAELTRANRQERNQSLQKGGILYTDGARMNVRKRVDNNAQKKLQDAGDALEYVCGFINMGIRLEDVGMQLDEIQPRQEAA